MDAPAIPFIPSTRASKVSTPAIGAATRTGKPPKETSEGVGGGSSRLEVPENLKGGRGLSFQRDFWDEGPVRVRERGFRGVRSPPERKLEGSGNLSAVGNAKESSEAFALRLSCSVGRRECFLGGGLVCGRVKEKAWE